MLQKLVSKELDKPLYIWECEILEELECSLRNLYTKPKMTKKEFDKQIEKEMESFKDESKTVFRRVVNSEKAKLLFLNDVEEENEKRYVSGDEIDDMNEYVYPVGHLHENVW